MYGQTFLMSGIPFRTFATGRLFKITKPLTCTSENVVFLPLVEFVICKVLDLPLVLKLILADYQSRIKHKSRSRVVLLMCMGLVIHGL